MHFAAWRARTLEPGTAKQFAASDAGSFFFGDMRSATASRWIEESAMTPNQVTAARVAAAFAAVALFTFGHDALLADATAILLTIAAIALDGLDGYIARKRNLA